MALATHSDYTINELGGRQKGGDPLWRGPHIRLNLSELQCKPKENQISPGWYQNFGSGLLGKEEILPPPPPPHPTTMLLGHQT